MRRVNRDNVDFPERLRDDNLTQVNRDQLRGIGEIQSAVYGHPSIKASLTNLYYEKCYICEDKAINGTYDVEHFLPKKHFKDLAYTWSNLHKVCKICNLAKENKEFKILNDQNVFVDIKLLDPSSTEYNVHDFIRFNIDAEAELIVDQDEAPLTKKAVQTVHLLNGNITSRTGELKSVNLHGLPNRRLKRVTGFMRFYSVETDLVKKKDRIRDIRLNLEQYESPEDPHQAEEDIYICEKLASADYNYFSDKAPFSTCTRAQLPLIFNMNYNTFSNLIKKMQRVLEI